MAVSKQLLRKALQEEDVHMLDAAREIEGHRNAHEEMMQGVDAKEVRTVCREATKVCFIPPDKVRA